MTVIPSKGHCISFFLHSVSCNKPVKVILVTHLTDEEIRATEVTLQVSQLMPLGPGFLPSQTPESVHLTHSAIVFLCFYIVDDMYYFLAIHSSILSLYKFVLTHTKFQAIPGN